MKQTDNAFAIYMSEIGQNSPLSDAEEKRLSALIAKGDEKALNRLTTANLKYVVTLAHQYTGRGLDLSDLVAEGNIGLLKAARRFDATKGVRFVAFAASYVREAIEEALQKQRGLYRVPRNEHTPAEMRRSVPVSIDKPLGGKDNVNLLSVLVNKNAPEADAQVKRQVLLNDIKQAMQGLDDRERYVINAFYGLDGVNMSMAEIAGLLNLKRERVRQIRKRAERYMYKHARNIDLKNYLRN